MKVLKMSDKLYDGLKWVAQYLLPAIAALYFALAGIWSLPYPEQVVGTITAIDAFLGVILGISTASWTPDGTITIEEKEEGTGINITYNKDLSELSTKKNVTLKVAAKG